MSPPTYLKTTNPIIDWHLGNGRLRPRSKFPKSLCGGNFMAKEKIKGVEDLPGVGPQGVEKLFSAGYKTLESIATASPAELMEAANLGELTAAKAINAAREALEMGYETDRKSV